MTVTSQSIVS